jgi:1,4-dihydroxy-2-naphthoyl-CoA hydrolase
MAVLFRGNGFYNQEQASMKKFPENILDVINENLGGYNNCLGLCFTKATPDEFVAEVKITDRHLQPYGLVHGGLYASLIETLCSTGAALSVWEEGKNAVGLENTTSFLRAVRAGTIRGTARPLVMGRRSHVWEAQIHDDRNRLVATGRVRLMILEPGAEADGVKVSLKENHQ